jgi:hypothetical protein
VRAPSPKITKAKWTGAVAQAVELLLCKWEALSSNPNPTKKNHFSGALCRKQFKCLPLLPSKHLLCSEVFKIE